MSEKAPQPSYHQVSEQFSSNETATILLRRSDGSIQPARVGRESVNGGVRADFITQGRKAYKLLPLEKTADDYQANLANELAESDKRAETEASSERQQQQKELGAQAIQELSREERYDLKQYGFESAYQKYNTKEVEQASMQLLAERWQADRRLKDILFEHGYSQPDKAAVDAIRTDQTLRVELGKQLRSELDSVVGRNPARFGERVQRNSLDNLKTDPVTGRKRLSRDYVVNLVLHVLGGSFDSASLERDPIEYRSGQAILGQHRDAAYKLLRGTSWQYE